MASNLPSSFSRPGASAPEKPALPLGSQKQFSPGSTESNTLFMFLSILALLISIASFYGAFYAERPLSVQQKEILKGIAEDLRELQNRDVTFAAPVSTTLYLDQQYSTKDMFPPNFNINMDFQIPLDTQLVAISATGQPVSFRVQENVPVKATIPISSYSVFGNTTVRIKKEFPVDAKFSSVIKVRAAYGKELSGIIEKIDELAGDSPAPAQ